MTVRKIIKIDEEKCNGCGQCVPACAEGAIQIIDGKARLVKDSFCDGLGACLGECPTGALTIEEREADAFDEAAVEESMKEKVPEKPTPPPGGCPGLMQKSLKPESQTARQPSGDIDAESMLQNWPLQLHLVSPQAPWLDGARLVIAADCTAFAHPRFHETFLAGDEPRACIIACPKLDQSEDYIPKLSAIVAGNDIRSIEVVHMEVPCCTGLVRMVEAALEASGKNAPLTVTKLGLNGAVQEKTNLSRTKAPA
jgi:NAD-dependent dihydropyrimidine dehydrogenase PreA subunit